MRVRGRGESAACCANCTRVIANLRWRWCRENSDANFEQEIITKEIKISKRRQFFTIAECAYISRLAFSCARYPAVAAAAAAVAGLGGSGIGGGGCDAVVPGGVSPPEAPMPPPPPLACTMAVAPPPPPAPPPAAAAASEEEGEPVAFFAAQTAERLLSTEPSCVPSE